MRKRPLLLSIVSLGLLSLSSYALAGDITAVLPPNDTSGCTALIQQGDSDPAIPTSDLHTLQICMNNCDTLYRPFGDQKRYTDMLAGTAYCRKSLNNLYFSSIAQSINDDLDVRTQQQNAANPYSLIEQIKAQQTKAKQNQLQNNANSSTPAPESSEPTTPTNKVTPPPVSTDGINWF